MTILFLNENLDMTMQFINSSSLEGCKIIQAYSRIFITCILELIINVKNVCTNTDEQIFITKYDNIFASFHSNKIWKAKELVSFISNNQSDIKDLVAFMVHKLWEEALICLYDLDKTSDFDKTCNWVSFIDLFYWSDDGRVEVN